MIETRNLCKAYDNNLIFNNFNLVLPNKGIIAITGASGCGKTTLIRLIAGLEVPDSGEIILPPSSKISMVFQENRLIQVLTAVENIQAVLNTEDSTLAMHCLERCGIAHAAHKYPHEMSGGMKRRLAVARAIAFSGDILILDEPFKGLDDKIKTQVMNFVFNDREIDILKNGKESLIILATHDKDEILIADQIVVI